MIKKIILVAFIMSVLPVVSVFAADQLPITTDEARDAQYGYIQPNAAENKDAAEVSFDKAQKAVQDIAPAAGQEEATPSQGFGEGKTSQKSLPLTTDEARGATY